MRIPLGPLTLSGEVWTGSNLDDYLGGVAQGIRVTDRVATAVSSTGGWGELALALGRNGVHVGFSIDDPDATDLTLGGRDRNLAVWSNAMHSFGQGLSAGLEVSRWTTRYVGMAEGRSWRVQASVVFGF